MPRSRALSLFALALVGLGRGEAGRLEWLGHAVEHLGAVERRLPVG